MSINEVELFKHKPLGRTTRNSQPFRLLEILPSDDPSARIECKLHHANLLAKPSFKALSYVWGDAGVMVPVTLESKQYDVTRNCYAALLRLRELGETKIWIDAICIDQKNDHEKCSQIPLMNYIYPAAKEVIVWLGHVEEERQLNSQETESMAISLLQEFSINEVRTFEQFLEIAQRGEEPQQRWISLKIIYGHAWFSRLWTHQELILSTNATFALDYYILDFDQLRLGTQVIHRASDQMTFRQLPSFVNDLFEDFDGFKDGLEKARIRTVARVNRHNPMHLPYQRISALNQVTVGTRYNCFQPRDRVYGLLGLLDSNIRDKIVVNYSKSLEEVYTDFAEVLIEASHSLEILTGAGLGRGQSSCPSWVQDWSLDDGEQPKPLRYNKYSASCLIRPNYSINRSTNELTVRGIAVDSIIEPVAVEKVHIVKDSTHHVTGAKGYHAWKQTFEVYPTGCDPLHAWIKTVTADMDGNEVTSERQASDVLEGYVINHRLHESFPEENVLNVPVEERTDDWMAAMLNISFRFTHSVVAACVYRTFFITKSGYMGIGPISMKKGDTICVVLGCNVPLLLRKHEDHYFLVGECFVWGLMDGEAMRIRRKDGYWLDTFCVK